MPVLLYYVVLCEFYQIEKLENSVVLRVEESVKVILCSLSLSLTGGNPSFILISPVLCDQSDFLTRVETRAQTSKHVLPFMPYAGCWRAWTGEGELVPEFVPIPR